MNRTLRALMAIAFSGSLLAAGCAEDTGSLGTDPLVPDTGTELDTGPDGDTPVEELGRLEYASAESFTLESFETATASVRYVTADGEPIADARIDFDFDSASAGGALVQPSRVDTDGDGRASTTIRAGSEAASFTVTASVNGNDEVTPLTFEVITEVADVVEYVFEFEANDYPFQLDETLYYLYEGSSKDCADAFASRNNPDFPANDSAAESDTQPARSNNEFDDVRKVYETTDPRVTYVIAFAMRDDVAYGYACTDGLPQNAETGDVIPVPLNMQPLWPDISGTYDIYNDFNLVSALPVNVQGIIGDVGTLFSSPGSFLVEVVAGTYLNLDLDGLPGWARTALISGIDGLFDQFITGTVRDVFDSGDEIIATLTSFKLDGDLELGAPDENGSLGSANTISLSRLFLDLPTLGLEDALYNVNEAFDGQFDASIDFYVDGNLVGYQLIIDPYSLDLNYGEVIAFIIEKILLPEIFEDPSVNSFGGLLNELINCQSLADGITDTGWINNTLTSICGDLLNAGGNIIRDQLTGLSSNSGDSFQLQTNPQLVCPLYFDRPAGVGVNDTVIGLENDQCEWSGTALFDGDPAQLAADFYANAGR